MPPFQKSAVFLNIVQKAFDPPPFYLNICPILQGVFLNAFLSIKNGSNKEKNIFGGINCRGRAPLNQRSFERCSKKFGHCSKICAMFKNSMFELRWRPLKSWAMGHLVFSLIGSQLLSSLKKLKTFALEFIFRVETHCWQYTHHNKLRMAISDVLTVYQSWKHLQLFDEVKVQMHRYNRKVK